MAEIVMRRYQNEADFWDIRSFLREVLTLNDRHEYSWPVMRWDYWRWHGIVNMGDGELEKDVFLWETEAGQIAAVLNRESAGVAFLQVHPHFKTPALEEQMIVQAEKSLSIQNQSGEKVLRVMCGSEDKARQELLSSRGYSLIADEGEHHWMRALDQTIPENPLYLGYTIRSMGDITEHHARSWASWRAFHSDQPDEDYDHDESWYQNIQLAPLYRRDLDILAVSPAGEIAAFTTIWFDDVTRSSYFEPVGTVPEHRRRGLASSLLSEGMRRLKQRGAVMACVGGESDHANALYRSVFGPAYDLTQPWRKQWTE